jgi:hypothetical protein
MSTEVGIERDSPAVGLGRADVGAVDPALLRTECAGRAAVEWLCPPQPINDIPATSMMPTERTTRVRHLCCVVVIVF